MKRKNEQVPGFDEIIFENRNKEYGAYYLRKHSDSATGFSIIGGVAFCSLLLAALTAGKDKVTDIKVPSGNVIEVSDLIIPPAVRPEIKPPSGLSDFNKNLAPIITTDSSEAIFLPSATDDIIRQTIDGDPKDTTGYEIPADPVFHPEQQPFISVQEMPEFPGGIPELMKFINENISYPRDAIINNIQGKVIARFVVNADGSVDRIQIWKGVDPALDNEAVRVISTLPRFRPGKQDGVPVPVWFSLPVTFRLENNQPGWN